MDKEKEKVKTCIANIGIFWQIIGWIVAFFVLIAIAFLHMSSRLSPDMLKGLGTIAGLGISMLKEGSSIANNGVSTI